MQDDPPGHDGDQSPQGQAPQEQPQAPRDQARPESPNASEETESRSAAPHPPLDDGNAPLNPSLSDVRRLFNPDGDNFTADGAPSAKSTLDEQLARATGGRWKSAKRERFTRLDHLTRYERGMEILQERVPSRHPALASIMMLCVRLQENIDEYRIVGKAEGSEAQRAKIIGELDAQAREVIQVSFISLCTVTGVEDEQSETSQEIPKSQRDISNWFGSLSWHERCYVIAACVLQGAPSHEVSRASNELYMLMEQAYPQRPTSSTDDRSQSREMPGPVFVSAEDLLAHTFTIARKLDGAERIMWQDEAFDPLVREFLARQAATVGMRFADRNLLDILQEWAISDNDERSLRAARVLAELWWRQHQDKVLELAEIWAKSAEPSIWQGGAALLYGAYAAERAEQPELKAAESEVLRRVREWADWRDDSEMAQVAAFTYGLLGRQWPEVALDGLDNVLCLGESARKTNTTPPFPVVAFAMLAYIELATFGHIRPLLARLARHAEYYAHRSRTTGRGLLEHESVFHARESGIDMLFFHFVFLAGLSLSGVRRGKAHTPYLITARLAPRPDMPSSRGQDVLLAGILSAHEPEWRANLQTLLCAAISEGRESIAFDMLASWIHIVTYEPHADATQSLLRFVIELRQQLATWDGELHRSGVRAGSKSVDYQLDLWAKATHDSILRPFAQRARDALQS